MREMSGHMLYGVDFVEITTVGGRVGELGGITGTKEIQTDGRVFLWENGGVTIYQGDTDKPWIFYPAHRVLRVIGKEHG